MVLDAPAIVHLRDLTRLREDCETDRTRLTNRLREQMQRVDAPRMTFCRAADETWLCTLLQAVPHRDRWNTEVAGRVGRVLRRKGNRRYGAADLVRALRRPRHTVAPGVTDGEAVRVRALIAQLLVLAEEQRQVERHIVQTLTELAAADPGQPHEHRDVEILESLPRVGRMLTATSHASPLCPSRAASSRTCHALHPYTPFSSRSASHAGRPAWRMRACAPSMS